MKVIDLLNKIANGEEVPEEIYYRCIKYTYDDYMADYKRDIGTNLFTNLFSKERTNCFINDEVEIIEEDKPKTLNDIRESCGLPRIEEDKKIEKIKILNCDDYVKKENYETILTMQEIALDIQTLKHKINEIIDYLEEKE